MTERVGDGPRIKFAVSSQLWHRSAGESWPEAAALARAMEALEEQGCCPILDDGRVAGNAAVRRDERLLVTPSGRRPGRLDPGSLVEVERFDVQGWRAHVRGGQPTSDTPLHHAVLVEPGAGEPRPRVSLHGHLLETERAAKQLHLPLSSEATVFSTPEDRLAMVGLVERHPYPDHRAWIRLGHGFVVVGDEIEETLAATMQLVLRARALRLLD